MELVKKRDFNLKELESSIDTYLNIYSPNTKLSYKRDVKDFLDTMNIGRPPIL